jgi:hypothetical protein
MKADRKDIKNDMAKLKAEGVKHPMHRVHHAPRPH